MFELITADQATRARRGRLTTGHGVVETPAYMPVGTQGSVKAVSSRELIELETQIVLGNTYHLFVRPGLDVIRKFGGLHRFMNWDGPILTDSGGYQIFSLAKPRKITEEGARFQYQIDGLARSISPEIGMDIQATLASNIAMVLGECPPWLHHALRDLEERRLPGTVALATEFRTGSDILPDNTSPACCRLALGNLLARSDFNGHFAEQPESKKLRNGGKEHLYGKVAANFQRVDDGYLKTSGRVIRIQEQDQHRQPAQTPSITLLK